MQTEPPKADPHKRKRRWFQFSLRTLLIAVVAFSFALAAMRFATDGWAFATVSIAVFLLLFSVVQAVYGRPFWVGFSICVWGYLALMVTPLASELFSCLVTTQSVWFLQNRFHPLTGYAPGGTDYARMTGDFRLIGQCLWALILATIGGMIARFAAGRERE
jgi:hypothetical protein